MVESVIKELPAIYHPSRLEVVTVCGEPTLAVTVILPETEKMTVEPTGICISPWMVRLPLIRKT